MQLKAKIKTHLKKSAFSSKVRENLWMYIATLLEMNIPLNQALDLTAQNYRLLNKTEVSEVLLELKEANASGNILKVLKEYCSLPEYITFRGIGKNDTSEIFETATKILTQKNQTKSLLGAALAVPAFLVVLMVINLYLFSGLVDVVNDLDLKKELSILYKIVSSASLFLVDNIIYICVSIVSIGIWIAWLLPNWTNKYRIYADNYFPFSLYKYQIGTSFLMTITELAKVGENITSDLLNEMHKGASPYFVSCVSELAKLTQSNHWGNALILSKRNFPSRELNLICSHVSQNDKWEGGFLRFLEKNSQDYNASLKAKLNRINLILLCLLGLIILAIINSTHSLQSSI